MRIDKKIKEQSPTISFEIFPPKKDADFEKIDLLLEDLSALKPDFISVTYGAGGSVQNNKTVETASKLKNTYNIEPLAHLTCIGASREHIKEKIRQMKENHIENILALRGDIPEGQNVVPGECKITQSKYRFAKDLVEELAGSGFCIGAAAYPEGHIDCDSMEENIEYLYQKEQAGANFFITQLFFDNNLFYNFREKALKRGVKAPLLPGVMPMLSKQQVEKMIFMCAASLPSGIIKLLNKYAGNDKDLKKAAVDYASAQLEDLLKNGVSGVHLYTMNKPDIAKSCMEAIYGYRKK